MDDNILVRYIKGNATAKEKESVNQWLEENDEHRQRLLAIRKAHDIYIWNEPSRSGQKSDKKHTLSRRWMFEALKIASVFLLAFFMTKLFLNPDDKKVEAMMQTIYVPAGQHAELTLSDGSSVWLNADSKLSFPAVFADDKRIVSLSGEGFFKVSADKEKPFVVNTANFEIMATGTEFNVMAYDKSEVFETSLLSGNVEVACKNDTRKISLTPDHKVSFHDGEFKTSTIDNPDYFLWRNGIISFDDEPIYSIFRKMELYFDVKIVVNNKEIKANKYRYTGKFRMRDGLEHAIRVLQTNKQFKYKKNEEKNLLEID